MLAKRFNNNKSPLRYILCFPNALKGFAEVCKIGEKKYSVYNFIKGGPPSQYVDSLLRHLLAFWDGEDIDKETGCLHKDMVVWNALALSEFMKQRKDLDDRPSVILEQGKVQKDDGV